MCGIIGQAGPQAPYERQTRALASLAHRGPDADGTWHAADGMVWLGQRRLAIVDLSEAGNQPMHNEDHTVWATVNGEIYNYPTLRKRLEALGHTFYSNSDSEAIIHAYEQWGDDMVHELEGMFAFILWDETHYHLFAARDRLGIKPLYYMPRAGGVALASEASALLPLLEERPPIEPTALAYVMTLGYIPSPWCIWQGMHKLEPGHLLTWEPETGVRTRRYWEPPRHIEPSTKGDWLTLFHNILDEHLLSDVPIGLFLSSGLDSTAVAAGLRALLHPLQAITVGFPGSPHDEATVAASTAAHLEMPHRIVPVNVDDVNTLLNKVAVAYDEPQGYSALLSMYLVSQVAAQDFKVVMAGDGGDEIFGGYAWYGWLDMPLSRRAPWIRRALRPLVRRNASSKQRAQAMKHFEHISPLHRHAWRLYPRFLPEETEFLLAPMGLKNFNDDAMLAPLRKHYEPRLPLKRALQRVDLMTFCTDSILAKVDRASMAHALEVRVPLLDKRAVEWALPRPLDVREQTESKCVLRDYLHGRVPPEVFEQPKRGFSLRVMDNFDWGGAIEAIRRGHWVQEGYWADDWMRLLAPGIPCREARIWNLYVLTRWTEYHLSES